MITLLAQVGPDLVVPVTVDTAPYLIDAFLVGVACPLGLWSILFVATIVKRGHRAGGGIVES